MSNPSITADKTPWYQWDTALTVTVSGGEMNECHFANRKQGTAYVQAVINGIARVPDELLQVAAPIKAYGYVSDGAGGQTYIEETFEVIARNIPADYTYTKTAQKTIRDAEVARDQAVQAAKDAKGSELAADDSAVEASKSAQSAGDSASAAATSASNAAKSAGDAAKSASDAKAAASKTVEDASELLKTYTDNAKMSADNAATSASNAADAASAASDSASAAEQSATDASNAKVAAQTAKAGAEAAKGEAATSASNAASSATAAAQSASDAAASVGEMLTEAKKYTDANKSNALVGTVSGKLLHVEDAWPGKPLGLTIDGAYKQDGTPSPDNPVPIVVVENPVLKVTGNDASAEGATLPITLPAEHPYLAALPDGTHDEIVIDKDGNASLVAMVGKCDISNLGSPVLNNGTPSGNNRRYRYDNVFSPQSAQNKECLNSTFPSIVDYDFPEVAMYTHKDSILIGYPSDPTELLKQSKYVYYNLVTPLTYQLGKLDIPSLPETISNVWTDAELTTNMSMTYKRDINIAFGNLVQAVVAAAAGE